MGGEFAFDDFINDQEREAAAKPSQAAIREQAARESSDRDSHTNAEESRAAWKTERN